MSRGGAKPLAGTALVLDFGSVISYSVFERHDLTEKRLGLAAGSIKWQGPMAPEHDRRWRDMLDDKLSERDYWTEMAAAVGDMIGKDWKPADFLKAARSTNINDEIRPEIRELALYAKSKGSKLAVLSNELELFYGKGILEDIELLQEFDLIVDGTYTRILKPDPRAYAAALEPLGIDPANAVFVDDQPRNVAGASEFGMRAVWFDVRNPIDSISFARNELAIASALLRDSQEV